MERRRWKKDEEERREEEKRGREDGREGRVEGYDKGEKIVRKKGGQKPDRGRQKKRKTHIYVRR